MKRHNNQLATGSFHESGSQRPIKRSRNVNLSKFLDIEAKDSDHEDEEEEDTLKQADGFIDDESTANTPPTDPINVYKTNITSGEGRLDHLVASIQERYTSGHRIAIPEGPAAASIERDPFIAETVSNIMRQPTKQDHPVYWIACKDGLEDEVVMSLLHTARPIHGLLCAFSSGSAKGGVYVEASMNASLQQLLKITPGVLQNQSGLLVQRRDSNEVLTVLAGHHVGRWVKVLRGNYRGDVGYILSVEADGARLLLLPRLAPKDAGTLDLGDRRNRFEPGLFDETAFCPLYKEQPVLVRENVYKFIGNTFEYGLIVKKYNLASLSKPISCMPLDIFRRFWESEHPRLVAAKTTFPKPSEWHFEEGESVDMEIKERYYKFPYHPYNTVKKTGTIASIRHDGVDLRTDEGVINVCWFYLAKHIRAGDFVEVAGGPHKGELGWVETVYEKEVTVIKLRDPGSENIETFVCHINALKVTSAPHVLAIQPDNVKGKSIPGSGPVPWKNTEVLIIRHVSYKGYTGIVKDVHCLRQTASMLTVVVELAMMGSTEVCVDYDSVVERHTMKYLYDFKPTMNKVFIPANLGKSKPIVWEPSPFFGTKLQSELPSPSCSTPMPEGPYSLSPAWNPLSRTPMWNPESDVPHEQPDVAMAGPSGPSGSRKAKAPLHPLLDPRLLNTQLKIMMTGDSMDGKEATATVESIAGEVCLRRKHYHTMVVVEAKCFKPKHPNPTRDNGLLVVIEGDHCGKYVRRIHHRYEKEVAIMILAVVERVSGEVDKLTGEQLEMPASQVCVCDESKEEKKRNGSLMNQLRDEARQVRAK